MFNDGKFYIIGRHHHIVAESRHIFHNGCAFSGAFRFRFAFSFFHLGFGFGYGCINSFVQIIFHGGSGDGALVAKDARLTGAVLKLGIDKLPQAARAAILGHTVTAKGVMQVKTTDTPIKIAVYAEIELNNGGYEAFWLLSGKAEPVNITGQQSEGNINYTTDELTINFIRRERDKQVISYADTDNSAFNAAAQTAFKAGPDIAS